MRPRGSLRAEAKHELLPRRLQLRHDRPQQPHVLPRNTADGRGGVQEEAVSVLRGGRTGANNGANSGRAGFSFFTRRPNKTEQNATVVVAESLEMWLDKGAERLGWLPGGQGPFGNWKTKSVEQNVLIRNRRQGLDWPTMRRGFHTSPSRRLESSPCLFYLVEITP